MQVLKKFGFLIFIILFIVANTYGQAIEDCGTKNVEIKAKKDPIDFIHNQVLKASASNPVDKKIKYESLVVAKTNSSKPLSQNKNSDKTDKKTLAAVKMVNEKAKLALQIKNIEKKVSLVETEKIVAQSKVIEKKATSSMTTNVMAVNNDLLASRTVTKAITPKKDENSFSSSVMEWVKDKYSCMINVLPNQISNVMLYNFIDEWYGVKYRMGGTSKKGVDCSAFVQTLYKYVFGLDILRTACLQFNSTEIIKNKADLKEGDLVFFRVNTSRISHVGVYLRNNFFVHSASSKGVSIANLTNSYWSKYFAGGGRIKS